MKEKKALRFVTPKSVFAQVMKDLGIDERMRDLELMELWQEVAGSKLSKKTFPHRFTKDRQMVVGVSSAPLAQELQFLKANLEKKFNELAELKFKRSISGLVFELRDKVSD